MFSFDYLSAEEEGMRNLLSEGDYSFYVKKIEERHSKAGNPQTVVTLAIHDDQGKEHLIWDYFSKTESMRWKIRHFFYCIGLGDLYELKNPIEENKIINRKGKATIKIDNTPGYKPSNKIKDYLITPIKSNGLKKEEVVTDEDFFNDSIPF